MRSSTARRFYLWNANQSKKVEASTAQKFKMRLLEKPSACMAYSESRVKL